MRKVIDGKILDTQTASLVCDISPSGYYQGDFRYEDTCLYKSPRGRFFISGRGGPMSRWAVPEGTNGFRSGSGLEVVTLEEAKEMCERHGSEEDYIQAFGQPEEG